MKFLQIYMGRITNEALKRSRLSDTNTDNTKRKAAILIILKSEDLLTLITKVRPKPVKTSSNPNGESSRRCITNSKGEEETIHSDDEYLYRHNINRLYLAPICFRFQVNKCPFGDKCKYRDIKDPNFIPRDNIENKDNNGADKKKFTPKMPHEKFTPNNNNRLVGPPSGKSLDGQAQHTQQCKLEH